MDKSSINKWIELYNKSTLNCHLEKAICTFETSRWRPEVPVKNLPRKKGKVAVMVRQRSTGIVPMIWMIMLWNKQLCMSFWYRIYICVYLVCFVNLRFDVECQGHEAVRKIDFQFASNRADLFEDFELGLRVLQVEGTCVPPQNVLGNSNKLTVDWACPTLSLRHLQQPSQ